MLNYLNKKLRRFCSKLRRRSTAIHHIYSNKNSKPSSNRSYKNGENFSGIHKSHGNESVAIYPNGGETMSTDSSSSSCNNNVNVIYNSSSSSGRPIRVATFNAALFSMAPAVSQSIDLSIDDSDEEIREFHRRRRASIISRTNSKLSSVNDPPKGILKQSSSPLRCNSNTISESDGNSSNKQREKFAKSRLRVSINLPDNEISLGRSRRLESFEINGKEEEGLEESRIVDGNNKKVVIKEGKKMKNTANGLRSIASFPNNNDYYYYKQNNSGFDDNDCGRGGINNNNNNTILNSDGCNYKQHERTVLDVLKEIDADVIALQDVKAEEEKEMKPLSDLASGLGMFYVFAESWAPEYGNALLSKWPIKHCHVQKIFNDADFRNVLKTTVDVPDVGDVNLYCTLLDHLDEEWRMKQINAIIQSNDHAHHILLGGLNSLDQTDYSLDRWTDIIKYYEDIGKPTPKAEVLKFLKTRRKYIDAKDFAGECESVVMIAKGQSVQGTCKYGTRVDYIMASPGSPYKFIPGSYSVLSSKGTSDHHIVKVDLVKVESIQDIATKKMRQRQRQRHNHPSC